jgi:hypothetical protein
VRRKLERDFARRHAVTRHDVELFAREPALDAAVDVQGATRAARALRAFLSAGGWPIRPGQRGRIDLELGWALLDRAPLAEYAADDDAALARVHRALRARLSG